MNYFTSPWRDKLCPGQDVLWARFNLAQFFYLKLKFGARCMRQKSETKKGRVLFYYINNGTRTVLDTVGVTKILSYYARFDIIDKVF